MVRRSHSTADPGPDGRPITAGGGLRPPITSVVRPTDETALAIHRREQNDFVVQEEREARTARWWLTRPFLIIVVAGCFHLGRGAPVDGLVFLSTAALLATAEICHPRPPRSVEIPGVAALLAVPAGLLVASWRPGTTPVAVAVAVTGPPMLYLALTRGGHAERTDTGTWWPWAVTGVAICLWELASFLQQSDPHTPNPDHPTLSAVLEPIFVHNPGRAVMIILWLAAGVLLARLMLRGSGSCTR